MVTAPVHSFLDPGFVPQVHWLEPAGRKRFVADPFGVVDNGRRFVFCELFDYRRDKGVIACFEVDERFNRGPLTTVIDLPHHASYPFIIHHEGTYYCVPETVYAREVAIFAATDFPYRWERAGTLIAHFAANDSTIVQHGGRWWLFCTDYDRGFDRALCIWHAPDLMGPWRQHSGNPVKIDNSAACCAGALFVHDDTLYRPAQDCSSGYGNSVALQRVDRLSAGGFSERTIATVRPQRGRYGDGLHTLSPLGDWTLLDGRRDAPDADVAVGLAKKSARRVLNALTARTRHR